MADARRWLFTKEQLQNTPSRADGVDPKKELSYRQQAASLIFDIGQKLNVNQNCVSTAVVFVHRFYMFHSFKKYQRSTISTSALFLACKVEEQPRKLEYVVKVAYSMMNQGKSIDSQSQEFQQMSDEVTVHELLILETLGFDVIVEHPHPYVVKCIQLIRASKDLGQTAYFMAHNSLLMTTMCLEYQPSAVACVCIHLACHWKEIEIPKSSDNKHWWEYINSSVDLDMLNRVADEFLKIYESCPSKIKKKMLNQLKGKQASGQPQKVPPSGGEPSSSGSHPQALPPADLQHSYLKPLPPRDRPKPPPQPGTTQQQTTSMDKPDPSVPTSGAGSGSGKKPLVVKNLPVLAPLTMSEEKKPSLVLPPLPRREGEERSRSPRDSSQSDKRTSSTQQRTSSHGHHKHRHGEGRPPPPPHQQQKYHDSSMTSSHQLHQHTTAGTQTAAHGGHKRQRNTDLQPHDAKRHKMELQPLLHPPPPPPPNRFTSAEPLYGQGQKHPGDSVHPDRNQHRLRFESAKTVAPSSSSLTVPGAAYSPISPPTPFGVAPPPPPPPLPPSQPPLPPPPLPPNSRPM